MQATQMRVTKSKSSLLLYLLSKLIPQMTTAVFRNSVVFAFAQNNFDVQRANLGGKIFYCLSVWKMKNTDPPP